MSSSQVAVPEKASVDPVKMLTGYGKTVSVAIALALAIVTLILVLGSAFAFGSAISDASKSATGYGLPNALETDAIRGGPLNARTYTSQQNKWLAALSSLLLAGIVGVAMGFIVKVASIDPNKVNLTGLSESARGVGSGLGSAAGEAVSNTVQI